MAEIKELGFTIANFLFLVLSTTAFFFLMLPFIKISGLTFWLVYAVYFIPFVWSVVEHIIITRKDKDKNFPLEIFISAIFSQIFLLLLGYIYLATLIL